MVMKLGIAGAAAALAFSSVASAQGTGFCADVEQIVAAGQETPFFASLSAWLAEERSRLAFENCSVSTDRESTVLYCSEYDAMMLGVSAYLGVNEALNELVSRIVQCRPDTVLSRPEAPVSERRRTSAYRSRREGETVFADIDGVRLAVSSIITSRFTRIELDAYDCAVRAADNAEIRAAWLRRLEERRREREAQGLPVYERPLTPLDPPCAA